MKKRAKETKERRSTPAGKFALVAAMVVGFSGLRIMLLSSYQSKLLGVCLALGGMYAFRQMLAPGKAEKHASAIYPLAGALVILGDLAFNLFIAGSLDLKSLDFMTLLFGLILLAYNYTPARFEIETCFLVIFFFAFILLQIAPLLLHAAYATLVGSPFDIEASAQWYVHNFLGKPLAALLNAAGIETKTSGDLVAFMTPQGWLGVKIGISCSGAYSFAIFTSAFVAYVLTKYKKLTRNTLALLAAGVILTYLANILRMLTTVLSGYFYGGEALVTVHQNAGWLIFMFWTFLFWTIMFKILTKE